MLVDINIAKAQTAYKREQLSKSFKSTRREQSRKSNSTQGPKPTMRIRRPAAA